MPQYVPLQKSLHKDSYFIPSTNLEFARNLSLVPVVMEEANLVQVLMPLAFFSPKQNDQFDLVGVQSLDPSHNLFLLPNGEWFMHYTPAYYRTYPFALIPGPDNEKLHLCIDNESNQVKEGDQGGNSFALLSEAGEPSEKTKMVLHFLHLYRQQGQKTKQLVQQLQQAGLLEPWDIKVKSVDDSGEEKDTKVQGLFHINRQALDQLDAEQLHELHKSGALTLAHYQLISEARLTQLGQLAKAQAVHQQQTAPTQDLPDMDKLFGEESEEDVFKF